jgi:hypothetical protein
VVVAAYAAAGIVSRCGRQNRHLKSDDSSNVCSRKGSGSSSRRKEVPQPL